MIVVKNVENCWFDKKTNQQVCNVLYEDKNGNEVKGLLNFVMNQSVNKDTPKCDIEKDPMCFLKNVNINPKKVFE